MILCIDGIARHLPTHEWLEFLDRRTTDPTASPLDHGWELGTFLGDLGSLDLTSAFDAWSDVLVTVEGEAVALTADQWLSFVDDYVNGNAVSLAEYGSSLGEVAPPVESLSPPVAKILAAGLRAVLSQEYEASGPVDYEEYYAGVSVAA